jgi:putative transposase
MAFHLRRPAAGELVHHTDRGSQYTSLRYTQRLADLGIAASVGSVADAYDDAMAETSSAPSRPSWPTEPFTTRFEAEIAASSTSAGSTTPVYTSLSAISPGRV